MVKCDVAIVGAGPYGLAAGAHLKAIKGLDVRIFGEPMEFWRSSMPVGMVLRSTPATTNISDPARALRIDDYRRESGDVPLPLTINRFVDYGLWFQSKALPFLERRRVLRIDPTPDGFLLTVENGEGVRARRVAIATGMGPFARRPSAFAGLPPHLASHCYQQSDLSRFAGKRVVVVGAGQSALESAALLCEAGAEVEVIARSRVIEWHGRGSFFEGTGASLLQKLLYAPTGVGGAGISRIVACPNALKYFPRCLQNMMFARSTRPTATRALLNRMKSATFTVARQIVSAGEQGGQVRLRLCDGSERQADHVLLGTGYKVDVSRYQFLSPKISERIRATDGHPHLKRGLESTVPGLHFLGAPAAWTFGPLMWAVAGTEFAASGLARHVAESAPRCGDA